MSDKGYIHDCPDCGGGPERDTSCKRCGAKGWVLTPDKKRPKAGGAE